jgi:hypothetical protein
MRILRGVSSRVLPCGCLVGVYETYSGDIVTIIDAHASACADTAHERGQLIPTEQSGSHPRTTP